VCEIRTSFVVDLMGRLYREGAKTRRIAKFLVPALLPVFIGIFT